MVTKLITLLKTKEYRDWLMSTHFWGPLGNLGFVLAGINDLFTKSPEVISGPMTTALCIYSFTFMRFAWRVKPRNLFLLGVHVLNESIQLTQLGRKVRHILATSKSTSDAKSPTR
jgi:hypothetical protein